MLGSKCRAMVNRQLKIYWNLSQPQHTPRGNALGRLYYDTDLHRLLDDRHGYPHNGMEHTLGTRMSIPDLLDWLDLVYSEMGVVAEPFIDSVKHKIKLYMEKRYETHND